MNKQQKPKRENPAIAALAARLSSANLHPAKPAASPPSNHQENVAENLATNLAKNPDKNSDKNPAETPAETWTEISAEESVANPAAILTRELLPEPSSELTQEWAREQVPEPESKYHAPNDPASHNSPGIISDVITENYRQYVGQIIQIPLEALRIEDNVRTQIIEDSDFDALVASIREKGVLQNLVVQLSASAGGAEDLIIISGQRRWLACRKAGKREVPCLLVTAEDQQTRIIYGLVENLMREDLTPLEIGVAYGKLIELGATQDELARTFACHRKTIRRYIGLTTWPEGAIQILKQHPRLFSTDFLFNGISRDILSDPDLLVLRLQKVVDQAQASGEQESSTGSLKPAKYTDNLVTGWNQSIRQNLGVPVTMSGSTDNLRITIRCKGDQNVRRVLEKLGIAFE